MTDYMDKLFDQFTEYRSLPESLSVEHDRIDHMWHCLGNLRGCDGFRFNLLFEVVKYILLLPHSNADEERIFSMASSFHKFAGDFRSLKYDKVVPRTLHFNAGCLSSYV